MTETLTNADNFWLCMDDPTNLMVISGFLEFEKPVDYDRFCKTIEDRLLIFDRFKKRASRPLSGVGVSHWELDPYFDLRSHVHRIALPSPGDKATLQEVCSDLMATPLDPTKPLWQCHLIENYGSGGVAFFRLHHCIADGIALIYVLLSTADKDPEGTAPYIIPKINRSEKPSKFSFMPFSKIVRRVGHLSQTSRNLGKRLYRELGETIENPRRIIEMTQKAGRMSYDTSSVLGKLLLLPTDPKTAFKGKLGVRKSVAWTDQMALGNIKMVGKVVEATLNDVLIATVTGALRRYLKKRNSPVNELDLKVAIPVNIRKPGTEFELGNKFSLVFLSLPVYLEDPVLRLKEVKRRMDELKRSADAYVSFFVLSVLGLSPVQVAKNAAAVFANKATGVMTNVPGPRQSLYYAGQEIKNMMFWVPRSGRVGLGISIFSYNDTVSVGLASDTGLVPDPSAVLEGFEKEFYYLLDLVKSGKVFNEPLVLHDRYAEAKARKESLQNDETEIKDARSAKSA